VSVVRHAALTIFPLIFQTIIAEQILSNDSLQCSDTVNNGRQEGHPACKKLDVGLSVVT